MDPDFDIMLQHPPGSQLNDWVARYAMDQRRVGDCSLGDPLCLGKYEPQVGRWPCLPPYSNSDDMAAAWLVLKKLGLSIGPHDGQWLVTNNNRWDGNWGYPDSFDVNADEPALAICRAALKLAQQRQAGVQLP